MSMTLYIINKPWIYSKRVGQSPDFGLPSVALLHDCVESDVKQYRPTLVVVLYDVIGSRRLHIERQRRDE